MQGYKIDEEEAQKNEEDEFFRLQALKERSSFKYSVGSEKM